ncbi:DUF1294 domain-containing protein [Aureimonas pseudogalii]|uniref:Uncharacterized membrane protein YsdA (DUF1294 family) n=1 Tax=Aureimonas pseudogalii TaxID=1744844 RepID=A0A7W6H8A8_9HYPH|nr:DUF1294 domain-containing protein [Aureimonas pseudogalii]MBB4000256.1 uncharacterized membrane protein YsdA (DUF1294 family) [Aureimonas pseudogalii]
MSKQAMIGVLVYGLAINLVAYAAMVMDKAKAENRVRRIPEATLLRLAFLGGSIGTVIAQQTIRHKTRKEPFRSRLIGILLLQIVVLIALTVALIVAGSPEALWRRLTL